MLNLLAAACSYKVNKSKEWTEGHTAFLLHWNHIGNTNTKKIIFKILTCISPVTARVKSSTPDILEYCYYHTVSDL